MYFFEGGANLERIRSLMQVQNTLWIYRRIGKRCLDLCVSSILLILLIPLYPLVALLLLVFSGRPLLFTQTRTGLLNQPFQILKFRTMKNSVSNTSKLSFHWNDGVPNDFIFKSPHNSEVTKVGAILRKTSIDELPQLLNVLRGEMSLIGPRPEIPEITNCYNDLQMKRLSMKPGLTGWAQVNGRADSCHGHKIDHDLYYVNNCSFKLDMKILMLTIVAIWRGKGAY
ncbi:sugar transferase [Paenisporosarcina quisquiliarum]|uniref:Sugar transferase n=1 Tax=Paenisporosarcina quisquiliarum TaxID=365346 RepID=A0A9X3LGC2_9BACL|nr:sugar transferase [Paenisporosarcina quisquiliarum]MCZ8537472.1 sugar transferase [Paenisporosarcina quisquiliarum]